MCGCSVHRQQPRGCVLHALLCRGALAACHCTMYNCFSCQFLLLGCLLACMCWVVMCSADVHGCVWTPFSVLVQQGL